jgi:hypothetical protein
VGKREATLVQFDALANEIISVSGRIPIIISIISGGVSRRKQRFVSGVSLAIAMAEEVLVG